MTSSNTKVAVIGAESMVGSRYCQLSNLDLVKADQNGPNKIDITNKESINIFFNSFEFDWLILFSAFTDVDNAEKQRNNKNSLAWEINVQGAENIVNLCKSKNKKIVFISTDYIFDGTSGPYCEQSPYGPNLDKVSWYGITKIEAEKLVTKSKVDYIILRISYPYRAKFDGKDDFARSILKKYRKNELYPLFADQKITPTFIDDTIAIDLLISKNQRGIFHLASPKITSPFKFAHLLIKKFNMDPKYLKKASLKELLKEEKITPRPLLGGLNASKIIQKGYIPLDYIQGISKIHEQNGI